VARDYASLEPIIYKMFDYGDEDLAVTHPEWGDVGSYNFFCWDDLHSGPGAYDFTRIERWLSTLAGMRRPSGAPQSGVLTIINHISGYPGRDGWKDCTPEYVYDQWDAANPTKPRPTMNGRKVGSIATENGVPHSIPYYKDTLYWWPAYGQFIAALGQWYAALPPGWRQILKAVFFAPGLDGEAHDVKGSVPSPSGNRFGQLCESCIGWWDAAFPSLPLFMVVGPGQGAVNLARLCWQRGIGIKNNGLMNDVDSDKGYSWDAEGNPHPLEQQLQVGLWDSFRYAASVGQPVWVESAHDLQESQRVFAHAHALHYVPVGIDLHSTWLAKTAPGNLDFLRAHMNHGPATAPSAWCVLRDMEYPLVTWPGSQDGLRRGYSGHPGDFCYYMARTSPDADAPRYEDVGPADAPESRQARRVTRAEFSIDDRFAPPPYRLRVRWLPEEGRDLIIDADEMPELFPSANTTAGVWETIETTINARQFTLTSNGAAVHRVDVVPLEQPEPPEPPEPPTDWAAMLALITDLQRRLGEMDDEGHAVYASLDALREMIEAAE
jgi:hypothetical protein